MLILKSFADLAKFKDYFNPVPLDVSKNEIVSLHAIEQYRKKVAQWTNTDITNDQIEDILRKVVKYGKKTNRLPGGAWEYKFEGVHVVAKHERKGQITVITCLGDKRYRSWWKGNQKKWITA